MQFLPNVEFVCVQRNLIVEKMAYHTIDKNLVSPWCEFVGVCTNSIVEQMIYHSLDKILFPSNNLRISLCIVKLSAGLRGGQKGQMPQAPRSKWGPRLIKKILIHILFRTQINLQVKIGEDFFFSPHLFLNKNEVRNIKKLNYLLIRGPL